MVTLLFVLERIYLGTMRGSLDKGELEKASRKRMPPPTRAFKRGIQNVSSRYIRGLYSITYPRQVPITAAIRKHTLFSDDRNMTMSSPLPLFAPRFEQFSLIHTATISAMNQFGQVPLEESGRRPS